MSSVMEIHVFIQIVETVNNDKIIIFKAKTTTKRLRHM